MSLPYSTTLAELLPTLTPKVPKASKVWYRKSYSESHHPDGQIMLDSLQGTWVALITPMYRNDAAHRLELTHRNLDGHITTHHLDRLSRQEALHLGKAWASQP